MFGSAGKFLKDRKGAFAMQFALLAIPLTVCTGLAVDGGRAFLARYELASAVDAAALAVGSTVTEGADLEAVAQAYVEANFRSPHNGPIALDLNPDGDVITLKGTLTIDTYFMPLVGQPHVTVSAESEVRRGGGNVEVAMALDVTQSMAGSKITALKVAAKDLVAEVVNDDQTPFHSRIAIAPWGTNLHAGSLAGELRGPVAGPTAITGAHWRDGANKTISSAGWRVGGAGKTISAATWKNGTASTITRITKVNSNTRIQVTTSGAHGYANGQFVRITGANGSYASLNNNIYCVADRTTASPGTFNLRNLACSSYITPPAGSTDATAGSSQRCYDNECDVRITTSAAHGFLVGEFVRITGVAGMTQLNNGADSSWVVEAVPSTTTFTVESLNGPSTTDRTSGGTASECYTSDCKFQVVTSASHGFANGDYIAISGATVANSGTSMNNTSSAWSISVASATTFYLPGSGHSYQDWSSGGSAGECYVSTCRVKITSASHGLSAGDYVEIASVGGFTGANTSAAQVASVASNDFYLSVWGPGLANSSSAYSTNTGAAQCLEEGCLKYRFLAADGSNQIKTISNCVTERTGAEAYTNAPPSTAYLGRDYPGAGTLVGCNTGNYITPLTANKTKLNDAIDDMVVTGSTGGQIGAGWAWYMISPEWTGVFTGADHEPSPAGTANLSRVAVLMTDGEFNTAHCNGVTSQTYAYSSVANSDRIASSVCTPANPSFGEPTAPFNQAQAICTAMKADNVIVYTVGFDVGADSDAADFLEECATDSEHAYLAADAAELKAAFKAIGKEIAKLRITR